MKDELNPRHPVTSALHEQWHKIAAVIMHKHGIAETRITAQDLENFGRTAAVDGMPVIVCHDRKDGLHLILLPLSKALEYVALNSKKGEDREQRPTNRN